MIIYKQIILFLLFMYPQLYIVKVQNLPMRHSLYINYRHALFAHSKMKDTSKEDNGE